MDSLERSLTYPTNSESWLKTVIIGGIFVFLSFLFLPAFLVYGYVVRVIERTESGQTTPPVFDDWGDLFVDGIKAWLVGIVYMLVPIVVAALTIGGALVSLAVDGNVGLTAGGLLFGLAISAVLTLLFGYIAVAAVVNFAREQRFGAAFDFGVLRQIVFHREYALAWLVSVAVLIAAGIVGSLPAVGWLLAPFVTFYALSVSASLWADGVSAALETTETTERTRGEQPAA